MLKRLLLTTTLACSALAGSPQLTVPSAQGPLTIDGKPAEVIWEQAATLPLGSTDYPRLFPQAGSLREVVRAGYLCLSAELSENRGVVARSTGENPVWWREDQLIWRINFRSASSALHIKVNPLGAYEIDYGRLKEPPKDAVLVAASATRNGWGVEVAVPLANISPVGFISAERIRVARPGAPEVRYYWPGPNETLSYVLRVDQAPRQTPPIHRTEWWNQPPPPGVRANESPLGTQLRNLSPVVLGGAHTASATMWLDELKKRVGASASEEREAWEKVHTVLQWEAFRDARVAALKESLGPFPERTPLHAEVTRRIDLGDGFVIENVIFESRPGLIVTANLYLPAKIEGRIPAVVMVHSHHAPKTQSELQDLGMTWARAGVAVLVMDMLGAGERLQSQPWPRESYYSREALGAQLYLAGESLMKWFAWDLMRGVDLLLERPYVDPQRIVMLGAVAGGGDPAAVTGLLDSRIAAVIPFNFGEAGPEEHYTHGPRPYDAQTADPGWGSWESTRNLRLSIAQQFFPWLICAARAPKPFEYSFEIGWPHGVEREPAWARYKKVYELYGARDELAEVDGYGPFPGPGEVTNVGSDLRRKIYPILHRWLNFPIPSAEYSNPRPESELMCLTPEAAGARRLRTAAELAAELADARLTSARANREKLSPAEQRDTLRAQLREKLGDTSPEPAAPARAISRSNYSGFSVETVVVESAPGIELPLMLIKPPAEAGARIPVVLALAQGGKAAFLAKREDILADLIGRGVAVCLADVRGTGETARADTDSLAATELMLGTTAVGQRVRDVRTIVHYLAGRADLDPKRIALWGESFSSPNPGGLSLDQSPRQQKGPQTIERPDPLGATLVTLAALYEDSVRAVAARGGLVSFRSALANRFCYLPSDVAVPGILQVADTSDIADDLAADTLLSRMVDGRNHQATRELINEVYGDALISEGSAGSKRSIVEDLSDTELARWIGERLSR
ncbi:MAG: acetylxylan esterase [Bryobacterales bacterium]|nr:acetylxylan esterase [Bryobacterales bacterium]